MNLPDRFWAKVQPNPETGCWDWFGAKNSKGYGVCQIDNRAHLVHRASWAATNGPIPDGLTLDHLCGRAVCVNPDHLEPVTRATNSRRGTPATPVRTDVAPLPVAVVSEVRKPGHCRHGHDITSPTAVRVTKRGDRYCLTCQRRWNSKPA